MPRACWLKYIQRTVRECTPEILSNPRSKLPTASKEEIIDWVAAGWRALQQQVDLIKKSFLVTGTTGTTEQIRNDNILKSAKAAANEQLRELFREYDDDEEDPFADLDLEGED